MPTGRRELVALSVVLLAFGLFLMCTLIGYFMEDGFMESRSPYVSLERVIGAVLILIALLLPYIWRRHKREKGKAKGDEEGIKTVRNFGKKVAWLTKKLSQ